MLSPRNNRTGANRHALKARRDDLYETPEVATWALLRVEDFDGLIWEPACGRGAISGVLLDNGQDVFPSDLVDYGIGQPGIDFLMEVRLPAGVQAIITNPPFKLADEFVRHALKLGAPKVAMLLRLAFLESRKRTDILENSGLARVHVFRERLPMMHRAGWTGHKTTSTTAYAWYVWERGHTALPTIHRLSWGGLPSDGNQA